MLPGPSKDGTVGAMPVLSLANTKGEGGRARSSRENAKTAGVGSRPSKAVEKATILLLCKLKPTGKVCNICSIKETEPDLINADRTMKWAYPETIDEANKVFWNQGDQCYVCTKVFNSQYKHTYKTSKAVKDKMGIDEPFNNEVVAVVNLVRNKIKEAGSYTVQIKVSDMDQVQKLLSKKRKVLGVEGPVDEVWEPDDYETEYGNWRTNGKGHRKGTIEGVWGIVVPGKRVTKIRRKTELSVELEGVVDDGENILSADQMMTNFDALGADLLSVPQAVGTTIDKMVSTSDRRNQQLLLEGVASVSGHPGKGQGANQTADANTPIKRSPSSSSFGPSFSFEELPAPHVSLEGSPGNTGSAKARGKGTKKVPSTKAQPDRGETAKSTTATGKGRRVGRPPRDIMALTSQQAESWEAAEASDVTFFGPGAKTHKSYLAKLKGELQAKTQSSTTIGETTAATIHFKTLASITDLQESCLVNGVKVKVFADLVESKRAFLRMDPQTELRMPRFMWRGVHEYRVVSADLSVVWSLLTREKLLEARFDDADPMESRITLIISRLASIVRENENDYLEQLIKFTGGSESLAKADRPASMSHVDVLAKAASKSIVLAPGSKIDEAVAATRDAGDRIAHSLTAFPNGRNVISLASSRKLQVDKLSTTIDNVNAFKVDILKADKLDHTLLTQFFAELWLIPEDVRDDMVVMIRPTVTSIDDKARNELIAAGCLRVKAWVEGAISFWTWEEMECINLVECVVEASKALLPFLGSPDGPNAKWHVDLAQLKSMIFKPIAEARSVVDEFDAGSEVIDNCKAETILEVVFNMTKPNTKDLIKLHFEPACVEGWSERIATDVMGHKIVSMAIATTAGLMDEKLRKVFDALFEISKKIGAAVVGGDADNLKLLEQSLPDPKPLDDMTVVLCRIGDVCGAFRVLFGKRILTLATQIVASATWLLKEKASQSNPTVAIDDGGVFVVSPLRVQLVEIEAAFAGLDQGFAHGQPDLDTTRLSVADFKTSTMAFAKAGQSLLKPILAGWLEQAAKLAEQLREGIPCWQGTKEKMFEEPTRSFLLTNRAYFELGSLAAKMEMREI
jgi:hypothetical protein